AAALDRRSIRAGRDGTTRCEVRGDRQGPYGPFTGGVDRSPLTPLAAADRSSRYPSARMFDAAPTTPTTVASVATNAARNWLCRWTIANVRPTPATSPSFMSTSA